MLSALQLHRKTIKFQKPDTTQGGITYKARCCLLFSVLNKILRVGASGWFITNRDSVHMICRPSPWREGLLFTGYLTRRFLASSADAQSWPVKYCAASSHSHSLHAAIPAIGDPCLLERIMKLCPGCRKLQCDSSFISSGSAVADLNLKRFFLIIQFDTS